MIQNIKKKCANLDTLSKFFVISRTLSKCLRDSIFGKRGDGKLINLFDGKTHAFSNMHTIYSKIVSFFHEISGINNNMIRCRVPIGIIDWFRHLKHDNHMWSLLLLLLSSLRVPYKLVLLTLKLWVSLKKKIKSIVNIA